MVICLCESAQPVTNPSPAVQQKRDSVDLEAVNPADRDTKGYTYICL